MLENKVPFYCLLSQ